MLPPMIGRYQIRGELGRGGMAVVYRAYDPEADREVAVKALPRELLHDPAFHARLRREVEAVAALEHPAIVPLYDAGEHEGQPFMVMRLMTGGSLASRLQRGPLSLPQAAQIIGRIAQALDAAHAAGLIHRDVKPDNVLFDHTNQPYLADFGIVSLVEPATILTRSGVVGTPDYMAPELTRPGGLSPLVDVYAMGAMLFEMLTGRPPYRADTPVGVLVAHVTEPIPRVRMLQPALPDAVQKVLDRALAKNPRERYQSATELAADLAAVAEEHTLPTTRLHASAPAKTIFKSTEPVVERRFPKPESDVRWLVRAFFIFLGMSLLSGWVYDSLFGMQYPPPYPTPTPAIMPYPTFTPFLPFRSPPANEYLVIPTPTDPPPNTRSVIRIHQMASVSVAEPGMMFSYYIGVFADDGATHAVTVVDSISSNLEILKISPTVGECSEGPVVRCTVTASNVYPAAILIDVRVRDTVAPGTIITNVVESGSLRSEVVEVLVAEKSPFSP